MIRRGRVKGRSLAKETDKNASWYEHILRTFPDDELADMVKKCLSLKEVHDILDTRTNPTWPTTWFAPRTTGRGPFRDVYSVMNNWGANHCAFSYGHIGHELLTLAAMLRIPVYMHNIDEDRIFRPSVWTEFGAHEPQAADFAACRNFGPLYGQH